MSDIVRFVVRKENVRHVVERMQITDDPRIEEQFILENSLIDDHLGPLRLLTNRFPVQDPGQTIMIESYQSTWMTCSMPETNELSKGTISLLQGKTSNSMDTLFFIFSKLVGLCLQIETWLAFTLALAAFTGLLGCKRLSASLSAAAFLAVTLISIFPFGEVLLAPLEAEYVAQNIPEHIDGIIVLGGAESPRKTMRWQQPQLNDASERLIAAASLAIAHPETKIVYAGGSGRLLDTLAGRAPLPPIAIEVLSSLEIDPERIIWEDQSRNTAENAQLSFDLVQPAPGDTWILITSAFHMGRAMASFEDAGWPNVVPYPVDYRTGSFTGGIGWDFSSNLEDLNTALREWVGGLAYRWTGR